MIMPRIVFNPCIRLLQIGIVILGEKEDMIKTWIQYLKDIIPKVLCDTPTHRLYYYFPLIPVIITTGLYDNEWSKI